jgi:hypothetical protein
LLGGDSTIVDFGRYTVRYRNPLLIVGMERLREGVSAFGILARRKE